MNRRNFLIMTGIGTMASVPFVAAASRLKLPPLADCGSADKPRRLLFPPHLSTLDGKFLDKKDIRQGDIYIDHRVERTVRSAWVCLAESDPYVDVSGKLCIDHIGTPYCSEGLKLIQFNKRKAAV